MGLARSMPWKGKHPVVGVVETTYATRVRLRPEEMGALEAEVIRLRSLEKWFVKIPRKRGSPSKTFRIELRMEHGSEKSS